MRKVMRKILPVVITTAVMLLSQVPVMAMSALNTPFKAGVEQKVQAADWSGNGSKETPYLIANAAELALLAERVNAGTTYKNAYFRLENNIDLSAYGKTWNDGEGWISIGFIDGSTGDIIFAPFQGSFDGNGKVISNLYIDDKTYKGRNRGLFGQVNDGGSIKNLGVENVDIMVLEGGAIVGNMTGGSITNCYTTGKIKGPTSLGGIAYSASGITGCYSTCEINSGFDAGGIACSANDIRDCYFAGKIISGPGNVGGIVSEIWDGSVTKCYNTGEIRGARFTGGIAGYIWENGNVTNCYSTGAVYSDSFEVGGIAGYSNGSITSCYNTGFVGGGEVGGIVGYLAHSGSVVNCASLGYSIDGAYVGRVVGGAASDKLSGNIAFADMVAERASFGTESGANHKNGLSKTWEELQLSGGFPAAFTVSPWVYEAGKLPGFGLPVEMPDYLGSVEAEIGSIRVTPPAKTQYFVGETLSLTDFMVKAVYSDGREVPVTDYTMSIAGGSVLSTAGTISISVVYQNFSASFDVTVNPVQLSVGLGTSRIVETLGAYLNIMVSGKGFSGNDVTAWLKVGEELLYPKAVVNGAARMYIPAAPEAGEYEIVVKSESYPIYGSCAVEVMPYNLDIWEMNYAVNYEGFIVLVFNEAVSSTDGLFDTEVSVNGTTISCELGADGKSLVTNVKYLDMADGTHKFTAVRVKYPRLFPSYYFTFSIEIVK